MGVSKMEGSVRTVAIGSGTHLRACNNLEVTPIRLAARTCLYGLVWLLPARIVTQGGL